MTESGDRPASGPERLERALEAFLAGDRERDELLSGDPELRELVTPMLGSGAEAEPHDAARRLGEFRVLREIGRGGMGVVHEAEQTSLARKVALKVLEITTLDDNPAAIARFRREGASAAALEHPGIVKIYALGHEGRTHWIAMELLAGGSLHDRADEIRARGLPACVALVATVADALEYAHGKGLVHRDVKPENILLREDGSPVLTDFGLVRSAVGPSVSQTGAFIGTPYYASPEQVLGKRVDARSDVFSLGVSLYELLAARRPFTGSSSHEVLRSIRSDSPPRPAFGGAPLPADLWAIVGKALEKDAKDRYRSAAELAADLRAFLEFRPVHARAPSVPRRMLRWIRHSPLQAALAASLLVSLAVGGYLLSKAPDIRAGEQAQLEEQIEHAMLDSSERLLFSDLRGSLAACDKALGLDPNCEEAFVERFLAPWIVKDGRIGTQRATEALVDLEGYRPRFGTRPSFARLEVELRSIRDVEPPEPVREGMRDAFELLIAGFFDGERGVDRNKEVLARAQSLLHRSILASGKPRFTMTIKYSRVVISLGDKALADDVATLLQTHWPERLEAQTLAGSLYVRIDPEKSVKILRAVLARDPNRIIALVNCATALGVLRRHREALELKERVVRLAPGTGLYWENVGITRMHVGNCAGAEAAGKKALQLDPEQNSARILIGEARLKAGDVDGAAEMLATALERNPTSPKALAAYGHLLERQKRYDEAAVHLEKSLAGNPDDPFPRLMLGHVHARLSDHEGSKRDFEGVLARFPENHDAVVGLALALHKLKDEAAVPLARKGLEFDELEGPTVQALLTVLHERSDQAGIKAYEERLEKVADHHATTNLAVILHRFGDAEGAVRVARRGLGYDGLKPMQRDALQRLLQANGDWTWLHAYFERRFAAGQRGAEDLIAAARCIVRDPEASASRDLARARGWVVEAVGLDAKLAPQALPVEIDLLVWGQLWREALAKIGEAQAGKPTEAEAKRFEAVALRCRRGLREAARGAESRPESR